MTQDKARKGAARAAAARNGESYTRSARLAAREASGPDVFDADYVGVSWAVVVEALDDVRQRLNDEDPYRQAQALEDRALLHRHLAAATRDPVYAEACTRSALLDESNAARIRFEHAIPTMSPGTDEARLGLRVCAGCGRPWQVKEEGACPRCPRLLHGLTPADGGDVARTLRVSRRTSVAMEAPSRRGRAGADLLTLAAHEDQLHASGPGDEATDEGSN